MFTKTPEQIEELKAQWCADPCWDLEDTTGFEPHRTGLKIFADKKRAEWNRENERVCRNCKFFEAITRFGLCRKNPPTRYLVHPSDYEIDGTVWPEVEGDVDWCGEFDSGKL